LRGAGKSSGNGVRERDAEGKVLEKGEGAGVGRVGREGGAAPKEKFTTSESGCVSYQWTAFGGSTVQTVISDAAANE